jgi:hypothetical protein
MTASVPTVAAAYPAPTTAIAITAIPYPAPGQSGGDAQVPPEFISAVQARLAAKLGIAPSKLLFQKATAQQWPDTSVGCPEPGKTYENTGIPGYLMIYSDGLRDYEIHSSLAANPGEPMLLCNNKQPVDLAEAPAAPALSGDAQAMADRAKQDLAKQLGIDPATITVVSASGVEWNDSSLGCAKPGQNYLQVITPGFLIRLDVKGKGYEYHTDSRNQTVLCVP